MVEYNTKITIMTVNDWSEVKDSALVTVHKKTIDGKPVTADWKKKMMISEHSPIRDLTFSILFEDIPRFLADELVRHTQGTNWKMGTWREDRINKPRSEQHMDDLTVLKVNLNAQSLINISQKRLCVGCASTYIVKLWNKVISALAILEPEIALVCVPSCVYRGGCPEGFSKCKHFAQFMEFIPSDIFEEMYTDINMRYSAYRGWRRSPNKKAEEVSE